MRRVVVTGMGAITPIGNDVETFWNGLKEKKLGFGPITYFDTTDYKAKLAAEVKDFEPKDYMDPKAARRMERFAQFAVAAARQALEDSSLDMTKEDPFRVGVCVSSGIGSLQIIEKEYKKLLEKPASGAAHDQQHGSRKRVHPVWLKGKEHQRRDSVRVRYELHR